MTTMKTNVRTWAAGMGMAAAASAVAAATGDAAGPAVPVVVVVKVAKPWYAPKWVVTSRMRETIPQYADLPGLAYKIFSFARPGHAYGGLYFWADRASAQAWFTPAWFERVRAERGVAADVRTFDAPVNLDNALATGAAAPTGAVEGDAVATLVTIATPAGMTRAQLVAEFRAALPVYRQVDGLLRKHFIVTDDGRFGGLYVWRDEAAARRWFDAGWHDRVRAAYRSAASVEWFDAPIRMPSQRAANRIEMAGP